MKIEKRTADLAKQVCSILGVSPGDKQARKLKEAIEVSLINAVLEQREQCAAVALKHGDESPRIADKIANDIRLANTALIANLSSMR